MTTPCPPDEFEATFLGTFDRYDSTTRRGRIALTEGIVRGDCVRIVRKEPGREPRAWDQNVGELRVGGQARDSARAGERAELTLAAPVAAGDEAYLLTPMVEVPDGPDRPGGSSGDGGSKDDGGDDDHGPPDEPPDDQGDDEDDGDRRDDHDGGDDYDDGGDHEDDFGDGPRDDDVDWPGPPDDDDGGAGPEPEGDGLQTIDTTSDDTAGYGELVEGPEVPAPTEGPHVAGTKSTKGSKRTAEYRAYRPAVRGEAAAERSRKAGRKPPRKAACAGCTFWQTRCFERPAAGSGSEWGERAIGCFDGRQQQLYLDDLGPPPALPPAPPSVASESLPPFLPVATEGLRGWPAFPRDLLFGVSLSVLLEPEGYLHFTTPAALRHGLRLPPDARVALLGTAPDRILEGFWALSERRDSWRRMAGLGLELATSATFSVWEGFPRFDQIFNQERNFHTYSRLVAEGVPAVPFLFWADGHDRRRALEWLREHREVRVVGAVAQLRQRKAFAGLLDELAGLAAELGRDLHFLLTGAAAAWKIELAFARLGSVTVATTQPIMKAIRGFAIQADLTQRKAPWNVSREELAVRNVVLYRDFCARLAARQRAA